MSTIVDIAALLFSFKYALDDIKVSEIISIMTSLLLTLSSNLLIVLSLKTSITPNLSAISFDAFMYSMDVWVWSNRLAKLRSVVYIPRLSAIFLLVVYFDTLSTGFNNSSL